MYKYISDLHLGHANIIKLCNRPFDSVREMDETIISNYNKAVSKDDIVIIAGDFCYRNGLSPMEYLEQLNGQKILVFGNHDREIENNIRDYKGYFKKMTHYLEIKDNKKNIVIFHYPISEWNGYYRDTIHLFGHIHNNIEDKAYKEHLEHNNSYNLAADILNFTPQSLEDVIRLNQEFDAKVANGFNPKKTN